MHRKGFSLLVGVVALAISVAILAPAKVAGFTQCSGGDGCVVPMGHEWITRIGALELLGNDPVISPDPDDPRKNWRQGLAKNPSLAGADAELARIRSQPYSDVLFQPAYAAVYAAIMGERWVDLGGFNFVTQHYCFENVPQLPAGIQYDHFMRRFDELGGQGGITAAQNSRQRFIEYFVTAATAPEGVITALDGGGTSNVNTLDRNYFLFGRALHLFEDSFSSEHTVRIEQDNYETLHQVKSYLCAPGSEQHDQRTIDTIDGNSGDVIWINPPPFDLFGWTWYRAANMKTVALVATEGTKDVWAAFIRTMSKDPKDRAAAARAEATTLTQNWMRMDEREALNWYDVKSRRDDTYVFESGDPGTGKGQTEQACLASIGVTDKTRAQQAAAIDDARRECYYNIQPVEGFEDAVDPVLNIPYNYEFKWSKYHTPPDNWVAPVLTVKPETRVTIRLAKTNKPMVAPDGASNNQWIYVKDGDPLTWILLGNAQQAYFRLADMPLFLSYRRSSGAVKLYSSASDAAYKLEGKNDVRALKNLYYNQYLWLDDESPYITSAGDPKNDNAQWKIEGLPAAGWESATRELRVLLPLLMTSRR